MHAGRWTVDSLLELGIPEGVRAVVGQRLSRLPEGTTKTLEAASVIGLEYEIRLLRAVAGEVDEELLSVL